MNAAACSWRVRTSSMVEPRSSSTTARIFLAENPESARPLHSSNAATNRSAPFNACMPPPRRRTSRPSQAKHGACRGDFTAPIPLDQGRAGGRSRPASARGGLAQQAHRPSAGDRPRGAEIRSPRLLLPVWLVEPRQQRIEAVRQIGIARDQNDRQGPARVAFGGCSAPGSGCHVVMPGIAWSVTTMSMSRLVPRISSATAAELASSALWPRSSSIASVPAATISSSSTMST